MRQIQEMLLRMELPRSRSEDGTAPAPIKYSLKRKYQDLSDFVTLDIKSKGGYLESFFAPTGLQWVGLALCI